jgi:hypothetical protein
MIGLLVVGANSDRDGGIASGYAPRNDSAVIDRLGARLRIKVGRAVRLRLGTRWGTGPTRRITGLGEWLGMGVGLRYSHHCKITATRRDSQVPSGIDSTRHLGQSGRPVYGVTNPRVNFHSYWVFGPGTTYVPDSSVTFSG